jgi:hypothetical protein
VTARSRNTRSISASEVQHATEELTSGNKMNEYGQVQTEVVGGTAETAKLNAIVVSAYGVANQELGRGPDAGVPPPRSSGPHAPPTAGPPEPGLFDWLVGLVGPSEKPDAGTLQDAMRRADKRFRQPVQY